MNKRGLAYLVGALRDGSAFYYRAGRNYTCVWYEKSEDYLRKSIAKRVKDIFGVDVSILEYKENQHRARAYSQKAFNCFVGDYGYKSPQENWETPKIIRKSSDSVISAYIAGFFDAEGDVSGIDSTVGFSQKNREALSFIR